MECLAPLRPGFPEAGIQVNRHPLRENGAHAPKQPVTKVSGCFLKKRLT